MNATEERTVGMYRYVTAWSIVGATLLASALPSEFRQRDARPNVLLILVDDAGYADFGFHGSTDIQTPAIDAIAATGVRFSTAYVTAAVCSPSRAGLLTGRYQQRFGHEYNIPPVYSDTIGLPTREVTLAQALQRMGYHTFGVGKWDLGFADRFHPNNRGFDDYFGFLRGYRSYWPVNEPGLDGLFRNNQPVSEEFEYLTDELADQAITYMDRRGDKPFFIYLSFNAVHRPLHAKPDILDQVQGIDNRRRRILAAMTTSLDEAVGRVLDGLRERNLDDNTIVIFLNDNGGPRNNGSSNVPLRGRKGGLFEGAIRVPFLMQWPRVLPKGHVFDQPVSSLDVFATVLDAIGGTAIPGSPLDGVSLLPYLTGGESGRPHETLYWRQGSSQAIRDGDWKVVRYWNTDPMLFNLAQDPFESNNVASENAERLRELLAKYDLWQSQMMAPRWKP